MLMVGEYLTDYNPLTILYHYSFIKSMSFEFLPRKQCSATIDIGQR